MKNQLQDRFLKRLKKKAKRGMRGWPLATIAYYGPNLDRASKVVVSIMLSAEGEPQDMRDWHNELGDVRIDPAIGLEILNYIEFYGALSVAIAGAIIGCPHQEGIDYHGKWCPQPQCAFWHGRDRFTGKLVERPADGSPDEQA